jgi:hypothetical protein
MVMVMVGCGVSVVKLMQASCDTLRAVDNLKAIIQKSDRLTPKWKPKLLRTHNHASSSLPHSLPYYILKNVRVDFASFI